MKDRTYFEIRLESLGGLGANLCGKMLGELGVKYLGLNGSAFPVMVLKSGGHRSALLYDGAAAIRRFSLTVRCRRRIFSAFFRRAF